MTDSTRADLYLSPDGDDAWSGTRPEPNAEGTDGPLASLHRAQEILRERKEAGELWGHVTVLLRGGRYPITKTLSFGPEEPLAARRSCH